MAEKYVKLADIIDTLENEWGYKGMQEDLNKLPSADVVEIVRCKDCGMSRETEDEGYLFCMQFADIVDEQAFCSYGERKEK